MTDQKKPMPIVSLFDGEPLASSEALAAGVRLSHASVIKLVRKHQASLERFGLVRFEIRPRLKGQHGGGDVEIVLLNEPQSTLLITMMRNTAIVVDSKVRLLEEFYRMREALSQQAKVLWQ